MIRTHLDLQESEVLAEMAKGSGFDVHCDQQEAGVLDGMVDFAGTADVQIFRDRFGKAVLIHGAVPKGMPSFTFPETLDQSAVFCGGKMTAQTMGVIEAGDDYSYRAPAGNGIFGCAIAGDSLEVALGRLHQTSMAEVMPRTGNQEIPKEVIARLRRVMTLAMEPLPKRELLLDSSTAGKLMEEALLGAVCAALVVRSPSPSGGLSARNHWRCVRKVTRYIEGHLGDHLRMELLCHVAGVCERTLEVSFREVTGMNPLQFIKTRRLNAARRLLRGTNRREISVKCVALGLGFWHLGYFSRDYKALFGESPSRALSS